MLLRCESGELSPEFGEWWKAFLSADNAEREKMLPKQTTLKKGRKKRSRKKSSSNSAHPLENTVDNSDT